MFVIAIEFLTRLLKGLNDNKEFHYHLRCAKLNIIQPGFADDLHLFSRVDVGSAKILFDCFQVFSNTSGIVANMIRKL